MKNANLPELKYEDWGNTRQTLHRWTQIVGKIRLSQSPWVNHSWHSTLYVTEKGLTTSVIHTPEVSFSIEFDFFSHFLRISLNNGNSMMLALTSETVASFYNRCFGALRDSGLDITIFDKPNELPDTLAFPEDQVHCSYDPEYANRFWRVLLWCDRIMKEFRSHFVGKVSPVHFFWGSFDLAVTRFSGRRAPQHPGGVPNLPDLITRDAYSHEVSSCGFWPGNEQFPMAAFYSYAYLQPPGFEATKMPVGAFYHEKLREFILPYDNVRNAASPEELLLDFFQCSYEAAANLGHWDRDALEHSPFLEALQAKHARPLRSKKAA